MSIRQGNNTIAGAVGNPLNERNISNCITEIPQDIKLELNNGTLTLKAGSKVYVPNGAGVFDEVVIASDIIIPGWNNTAQGMLTIKPSTSDIWVSLMNQQYSGSTTPTSSQYELWYDTDSNKVKTTSNTGSTWTDGYSLPIALITSNGSSWTSIDQVFNGFGYIGSTVFALPGVKGLIPDGRNADGSLKSTSFTINEVHTATFSGTTNYTTLVLSPTGWIGESINYSYVEDINYNIWGGNKSNIQNSVLFGKCELSSGAISNFNVKTVFHAVDYNDVANQAMPDYTAGVSRSINIDYTESKNGYLVVTPSAQSANSEINIEIAGQNFQFWQGFDGVDYNHLNIGVFPIPRNVTYRITRWQNVNVKFFPCIGG